VPPLARYDRQVAAALFEPAANAKTTRGPGAGLLLYLKAMAVLDPPRAVETIEAMPQEPGVKHDGTNWLRIRLSEQLGWETEGEWSHIERSPIDVHDRHQILLH
jgi:hypothetical protein